MTLSHSKSRNRSEAPGPPGPWSTERAGLARGSASRGLCFACWAQHHPVPTGGGPGHLLGLGGGASGGRRGVQREEGHPNAPLAVRWAALEDIPGGTSCPSDQPQINLGPDTLQFFAELPGKLQQQQRWGGGKSDPSGWILWPHCHLLEKHSRAWVSAPGSCSLAAPPLPL